MPAERPWITGQDMHSTPTTDTPVALSDMAEFVRRMALLLDAQSNYSISRLTIILGRYVSWAHTVRGLPLAERLIFDPQVVELYIRDSVRAKKLAKASVAAYRSVLYRASEVLLPSDDAIEGRSLGAPVMLAPYSDVEVAQFPTWARGQTTELKRKKATALMCLGLGCGLRAREINSLRRADVSDDGHIIVSVGSDRGSRRVPMLRRYESEFRRLIDEREADDFIFGSPQRGINANAISEFVTSSAYRRVKPNTYRMRSTWIVGRLVAGVELRTLLEAADLARLEKLGDYLSYLPEPTESAFAALAKEARK